MNWRAVACVGVMTIVTACGSPSVESLSEDVEARIPGYSPEKDGSYAPDFDPGSRAALVEAGEIWLQKLNDSTARSGFEGACRSALDSAASMRLRFVPLSALGKEVEAGAARTLSTLLPLTPSAPSASMVHSDPYLLVYGFGGKVREHLLVDCLERVEQAPNGTVLAKALRPFAEERDRAVFERYTKLREGAAARTYDEIFWMPMGIMWTGDDVLVFATPQKPMRFEDADALSICGFDPKTSPSLAGDDCQRLVNAETRHSVESQNGGISIPMVKRWLLENFESPAENFTRTDAPPLDIQRTVAGASKSEGAQK